MLLVAAVGLVGFSVGRVSKMLIFARIDGARGLLVGGAGPTPKRAEVIGEVKALEASGGGEIRAAWVYDNGLGVVGYFGNRVRVARGGFVGQLGGYPEIVGGRAGRGRK